VQFANIEFIKGTDLVALIRDMHQLINFRHLDIIETYCMKEMLRHLGRLKCLQTLSTFIISKNCKSCMQQLVKLINLRRSLSIFELQNVEYFIDAKDINLRDKSVSILYWQHFG
jgi:hypothetical protein